MIVHEVGEVILQQIRSRQMMLLHMEHQVGVEQDHKIQAQEEFLDQKVEMEVLDRGINWNQIILLP